MPSHLAHSKPRQQPLSSDITGTAPNLETINPAQAKMDSRLTKTPHKAI